MAVKGTVPLFDPDNQLRGILTGETTHKPAPRSQFRLEDVREYWTGTDRDLHDALIRLTKNGEISIFPLNEVVKIRVEKRS